MLEASGHMLVYKAPYHIRVENVALSRPSPKHKLRHHPTPAAAEPGPDRHGEPHLGASQDAGWQDTSHALPQDPLGRGSLNLQPSGSPRREFHEPVIQER